MQDRTQTEVNSLSQVIYHLNYYFKFIVLVVPAEWLDGKNTLFGQVSSILFKALFLIHFQVTEGLNVVQKINQTPTFEKSGRPRTEISIISISLKT